VAKAGESKRVKAGSAAAARLEKRIEFVQEYIKLWRQFFERFADDLEGRKIYKRDEDEFKKIFESLAHHHYQFTSKVYPEMSDTDGIVKILSQVISLSHLKNVSEAQLSKLQVDWHSLFIEMNKALGRLIARRALTPEELKLAKGAGPPPEEAPSAQPAPDEPS